MDSDLRRRLGHANDLAPPDLWDEALTRARLGVRPIPTIPSSSTARSRVIAGAVAFAVFLLAGAFAWTALRPPGDGFAGSGGPAHEMIAVFEPSESMLPTIEEGQTVVVDVDAYAGTTPSRGDVVAFTVADYPDLMVLKRVIGLPGDTVEQVEGVVRVNGEPLDEPYVVDDPRTLGPWTVEPGHLFVIGRQPAELERLTLLHGPDRIERPHRPGPPRRGAPGRGARADGGHGVEAPHPPARPPADRSATSPRSPRRATPARPP